MNTPGTIAGNALGQALETMAFIVPLPPQRRWFSIK